MPTCSFSDRPFTVAIKQVAKAKEGAFKKKALKSNTKSKKKFPAMNALLTRHNRQNLCCVCRGLNGCTRSPTVHKSWGIRRILPWKVETSAACVWLNENTDADNFTLMDPEEEKGGGAFPQLYKSSRWARRHIFQFCPMLIQCYSEIWPYINSNNVWFVFWLHCSVTTNIWPKQNLGKI